MHKFYIAIDLKSFYASVECVERNLDPLTTNLIVADNKRSNKTICLAVSPSLKAWGVPGRPRLFEVIKIVDEINNKRRVKAANKKLIHQIYDNRQILKNNNLALDYIIATPRMAYYIEYSKKIYDIYLKYVAPEDMHVYSIDEVFIDATPYLKALKISAEEFAKTIVQDVLKTTGITATAGVGTNLYLCKVAMDIIAKKIKPDKNGLKVAVLDEMLYRKLLWNHQPLTDFWRIGTGYRKKLEAHGLYTMGDIARCSLGEDMDYYSENLLYKLFGVNAELLIDHAWGYESCTMQDIKAYTPKNHSLSTGQVLHHPYSYEKALLAAKEMTDILVLNMVEKGLLTNQISLTINYDVENVIEYNYDKETIIDRYGRKLPKPSHGSISLLNYTSSTMDILKALTDLYHRIVNYELLIKNIYLSMNVINQSEYKNKSHIVQLNLFCDTKETALHQINQEIRLKKERELQLTLLKLKNKYGKNSILRGMNLLDNATAKNRNIQIGGHKA